MHSPPPFAFEPCDGNEAPCRVEREALCRVHLVLMCSGPWPRRAHCPQAPSQSLPGLLPSLGMCVYIGLCFSLWGIHLSFKSWIRGLTSLMPHGVSRCPPSTGCAQTWRQPALQLWLTRLPLALMFCTGQGLELFKSQL